MRARSAGGCRLVTSRKPLFAQQPEDQLVQAAVVRDRAGLLAEHRLALEAKRFVVEDGPNVAAVRPAAVLLIPT